MSSIRAITPKAAADLPNLAAARNISGLPRLAFIMSALIVGSSLVLHTPETSRPKKWRMVSKPVPATMAPIERLLTQAKPGAAEMRRKKAKRNPRRLRFAAVPRSDVYKAVRVAATQLPPGLPGLPAGGSDLPAMELPFLGRMVAAVLSSHSEVLGQRLARPG